MFFIFVPFKTTTCKPRITLYSHLQQQKFHHVHPRYYSNKNKLHSFLLLNQLRCGFVQATKAFVNTSIFAVEKIPLNNTRFSQSPVLSRGVFRAILQWLCTFKESSCQQKIFSFCWYIKICLSLPLVLKIMNNKSVCVISVDVDTSFQLNNTKKTCRPF